MFLTLIFGLMASFGIDRTKVRPPLFVWRWFAIGLGIGLGSVIVTWISFVVYGEGNGEFLGDLAIDMITDVLMGTINGFASSTQWWANHLPERQLGVIGIFLILFGFVLALAQPLADILDLPVH